MIATVSKAWFAPAISSVLQNRRESLVLVGAGVLHLGLNLAGLPGWVCPIRAATGVPCPGCGLTTATVEFVHGDFAAAFRTHAFAPLFLTTIIIGLTALVLPVGPRQRFVSTLARFESRTGITAWMLLALILYWGARLPGSL